MSARKSLSIIAASSVLPCVASAQDGGTDAGPSDVLYQNAAPSVGRIWAELDFLATYDDDGNGPLPPYFYDYSTEVADDFIVPEGDDWSIERIFVNGTTWDETMADPKLTFAIRSNTNDLPGEVIPGIGCSGTAVTPEVVPPANLSYVLPAPCVLEPGHYWLVLGVNNPGTGFYYMDVTSKTPAATDLPIAVRSACGLEPSGTPGTLPAAFASLPNACVSVPPATTDGPFDPPRPTEFPNLALKFGLFLVPEPPVSDAGVVGDSGTEDSGTEDSGVEVADGGADQDAATGGDGDGDSEAGDGDGDSIDGGSGELAGGGCECSTTSSPERGVGVLSFAAFALWLSRRRRKSPRTTAALEHS